MEPFAMRLGMLSSPLQKGGRPSGACQANGTALTFFSDKTTPIPSLLTPEL
jgi:hypothetical protein